MIYATKANGGWKVLPYATKANGGWKVSNKTLSKGERQKKCKKGRVLLFYIR